MPGRYVVLGAGAVGGIFAGYLAEAGVDVTMVSRPAHVEAVRRWGLELILDNGDRLITHPKTASSVAEARPQSGDIVLLTCKTFDTLAALAELGDILPSGPRAIVNCQNSVRNEEMTARVFPRVYGAALLLGGRLVQPGRVHALNGLGRVTLGRYPTGTDAICDEIGADLRSAGFGVTVSDDIMVEKWSKTIINCGNAIYAITNIPSSDRATNPALIELSNLVVAEVEAAYEAAGIRHHLLRDYLPKPSPNNARVGPVPASGLEFYTSTWNDLIRRLGAGHCETDWFNGEISRLGHEHDVLTPANDALLEIALQMAVEMRPPGWHSPEELLKLVQERSVAAVA